MVSYDFKANLTTILSTYLIPVLVGCGCTMESSSAIVGLVVTGVIVLCNMLNEMYTSKHLTRGNSQLTIEDDVDVGGLSDIITEEAPVSHDDFYEDVDEDCLTAIEIGGL